MLAITESHPARPHISAAAFGNPVLDWTSIFPQDRDMVIDDIQPVGQGNNQAPKAPDAAFSLSVHGLINLRQQIFCKAEHYFDPFASPLLFFRTPGFDLPQPWQQPGFFNIQAEKPDESLAADPDDDIIKRKRTYYRAFPPKGSGMMLPSTRIMTDTEFSLRHQSEEFVALMSRSIIGANRFLEPAEIEAIESRFTTQSRNEDGSWNNQEATELGQWLGEELRRS